MHAEHQRLIFVVDDDSAVIEALNEFLVGAGFRVRTFSDGQEALDFAELEEPDTVISDVQMPRLDGVSLARQIRRKYPYCRMLLMSGDAITDCQFKMLRKPFNLAALSAALANKD